MTEGHDEQNELIVAEGHIVAKGWGRIVAKGQAKCPIVVKGCAKGHDVTKGQAKGWAEGQLWPKARQKAIL